MAKETKQALDMEELVSYTAPMDLSNTNQRDIVVAVNGEMLCIKRGETVQIKRKYLEALENADRQRVEVYKAKAEAKEQSKKASAEL